MVKVVKELFEEIQDQFDVLGNKEQIRTARELIAGSKDLLMTSTSIIECRNTLSNLRILAQSITPTVDVLDSVAELKMTLKLLDYSLLSLKQYFDLKQ